MLVRHTIIYFLGKVAPALLTMISMVIFTRLATPEQYGTFSLISVIVGLINILFFQWLRSSLLRFYNDKKNTPYLIETILNSHFHLLGLMAFVFILIGIIIKDQNNSIFYLVLMFIMLFLLSSYELMSIYFRANLKPKKIVRNNIIKTFLFILISTILLYNGFGVWGLLLGNIVSSIIGLYIYFRNFNKKRIILINNKETFKKLFKYGLPITFSFALSVALQNIDKIMISIILGVEQNGVYSVSYDLIHNLLYMIMTSFALAGFPIVLKVIKNKGEIEGKKEFTKYGELFFFISVPATVGLLIVSTDLVGIIIDENYIIPSHLINLIVISTFFHGVKSHYFDLGLQVSTKTRHFFIPALVAIIVNIVMNYFLLYKFGIEGAAFATLTAFFLAMIISGIYSKKNYKIKLSNLTLLKIIFLSSLMYIIVNKINMNTHLANLVLKVMVGSLFYIISAYILNVLNIRKMSWKGKDIK